MIVDPDTAPTLDPDEPSPGELKSGGSPGNFGPYEIIQEVGRGGMGVVYKAFHPGLKRTVALKVLIAGEDASAEAIGRFHREAEAVAKLGHHPNIVPVYDIGEEGNKHYFAMHFVEGKPLDLMIDDGEIAPKRAAVLSKKIAEALHHAHRHGVLHRDVKPSNVLVSLSGEPQITDFGLAKDVESDAKMTTSGVTLGTPHYMPPEQADGRLDSIDERSDVYSLGATLYEMLTLQPPFEGGTVVEIIRKVLLVEPVSPRKKNPMVEKDLDTICLKCLEKAPQRRYVDAAALSSDLGRFLEGKPIEARPASIFEKIAKRARRNKAAAAALVVLAFVLTGGAVGGLLGLSEWADQRRKAREASVGETDAKKREKRALELLEKGRAVSAVFRAAEVDLSVVISKLKAKFVSDLDPEEMARASEALWRRVEDFEKNIPPGNAAKATWLALKGWLRLLDEDGEEALRLFREATATDPDVPYGKFFHAMVFFREFLAAQVLPEAVIVGNRIDFRDVQGEDPEITDSLKELDGLLAQVRDAPVWGESSSKSVREVLEGFGRIGKGEVESARDGLSKALGIGEFFVIREEILNARALVHYRMMEFERALEDFEKVGAAFPNSPEVHVYLAMARGAKALTLDLRGEDSKKWYRLAVESWNEALKGREDDPDLLYGRGTDLTELAASEAAEGRDPTDLFERALGDLRKGLAIDPECMDTKVSLADALSAYADHGSAPGEKLNEALALYGDAIDGGADSSAYRARGSVYLALGDLRSEEGGEGETCYRKAVEDATRRLEIEPRDGSALLLRALARTKFLSREADSGVDPGPTFEAVLKDVQSAMGLDALDPEPHLQRAETYLEMWSTGLDWIDDPAAHVREAVASAERAVELKPGHGTYLRTLGKAYETGGDLKGLMGEEDGGLYEKASRTYRLAFEAGAVFWGALDDAARLRRKLGDFAGAAAAFSEALPHAGGEAEQVAADLEVVKAIATAPDWVRQLEAGAEAVESGAMVRGLPLLENGLEGAKMAKGETLERFEDSLAAAHYGCASCLAMASTGRSAPLARRGLVSSEEASGFRARAVDHLRKAVEFGLDDLEALEEDTDLDPLREFPAFRELLAELRRNGK